MSESSETPYPEKPPRSTQFKPGQSGNPLGRPRRKLDMSVTLNKALNDKIRVTNLGTTRTGMEAFVQSIVDRVLQGDSKGIPQLMSLFNKAKVFKPVPNPTRLTGVVVEPPAYRRDKRIEHFSQEAIRQSSRSLCRITVPSTD
jgi:predicted YcjX-like family ATPase